MKKQDSVAATVGYTGRMTRSRAANLKSSTCVASSSAPTEQNKKGFLQAKPKRAALDENNINVADNPRRQPKRRAVLQDVTNVCCDNAYRSCFNATKIQVNMLSPLFVQIPFSELLFVFILLCMICRSIDMAKCNCFFIHISIA